MTTGDAGRCGPVRWRRLAGASPLIVLLLASTTPAAAERPVIEAPRVARPPAIDGRLDDDAWQRPPLALGDWLTYFPTHGQRLAQQSDVWVAYDLDHLYVAFRLRDPDPGAIRGTLARRDTLWTDDWVGLSLDALGTGQVSYDLFVNPRGVQADILNSSAAGNDMAPDWPWESAGRRTPEGYDVELRLPLQSIRFAPGAEVRMGVLFWRAVSRLGTSVSWPALEPGRSVFDHQAVLVLRDLVPRLPRQLIPSAVAGLEQARTPGGAWGGGDGRVEPGLTAKVGLASWATLDATANPDFSQVESDAFQVDVNQRFPLFFAEKRPFFMEGAATYEFAWSGFDSTLRTAIDTRRIVDPRLGAKLTGAVGRLTFATLHAVDDQPLPVPGAGSSAPEPDRKVINAGRALWSLGPGGFAGVLVTDSRAGGAANTGLGLDAAFRVSPSQRLALAALATRTRRDGRTSTGAGAFAQYDGATRRGTWQARLEHLDEAFALDTAFYARTGLTRAAAGGALTWQPTLARAAWLKKVAPGLRGERGRDRVARGDEWRVEPHVDLSFSRQGYATVFARRAQEPFAGREFEADRVGANGGAQLAGWLNASAAWSRGQAVFFDPNAPFAGRSWDATIAVTLQPLPQLLHEVSATRVDFRRTDGARVFQVDIVNTRLAYQFTRALAARLQLRYDSASTRLATDLVASYEPTPGTVLHAGYGSLAERSDDPVTGLRRDRQATARTGFFKASYLWRF